MDKIIRSKMVCVLFIIAVLLLVMPSAAFADQDNLFKNSGFEASQNGMPDTWSQDMWLTEEGASRLWIDQQNIHGGASSAAVQNLKPNHARWVQKVTVRPNTYYKISGWVKTEGIPAVSSDKGAGANLFISGVSASYPQAYDTGGAWQALAFTGVTGPEQTEVTIGAGLGQYGALTTGTAYFDDIQMEQTAKPASTEGVISMDTSKQETVRAKQVSITSTVLMLVLFSLFFTYMYRIYMRKNPLKPGRINYSACLGILLVAAAAIRLWIAWRDPGYTGDMNTFIYWSNRLKEVGLGHFYAEGIFADYPPGYLYVLYVLGGLKSLLSFADQGEAVRLLFKLPAILADLAAGVLLYRIGGRKLGPRLALGLSFIYLLNPAIWINSASWGQIDAFFSFFLIVFLYRLTQNRPERAAVWFALAVLIKPQALIFTPVLLLFFIYQRSWKRLLFSIGSGAVTLLVLAVPFIWNNGGISRLYHLYKDTLSSYPYASLNAFNLFALAGGNWKPIEHSWFYLTFQTWGIIFIVLSVIAVVVLSIGKGWKDEAGQKKIAVYLLALILITCLYVLGPKMHERYLFPAMLLCLFSFIQLKDRRLLILFFGFSAVQYLNVDYVLKAFKLLNSAPPIDGVAIVGGIIYTGLLAFLLYTAYDILFKGRVIPLPILTERDKTAAQEQLLAELDDAKHMGSKVRMRRKDWLFIGAITLVYAIVALYHLGDFKSPSTYWKTSAANESFYVDLGTAKSLERVNLFAGPGRGKVKIEFSNTPDQWDHQTELDLYGKVFKWNSAQSLIEARYIKFTMESANMVLHEVAIYERNSKTALSVADIKAQHLPSNDKGSPQLLFDEPDTDAYKPTYMNSSYFDEIYHPRTAFEYLEGMPAYENTHPPLGKILIAVGIKLFGLSPFGWRIVGTVFGIGMLPLIYRMALSMFKKTPYAITAALLFAVDFMHFAQTRMSTIDVYATFFMMLMYYFMYRYVSLNFYAVSLRKTWIPLGLSGLFFGIGVASKWNVAYGGAGLALMLGLSLYSRYRESRAAAEWLKGNNGVSEVASEAGTITGTRSRRTRKPAGLEAGKQRAIAVYTAASRYFWRNTLLTLAFCLIFFIVIPAVIYSLSFIPVLKEVEGGYTLHNLIQAQVHMYDYHSELTATHPYSSQWWQWPFMKRPLWLYNGTGLEAGMKSTIVTMGNPLIWWTGLFTMFASVWFSIKRKDRYMYMVWIAYFSVYIPWTLVPRYTFIYHYFTMVPFSILSTVYIMKLCEERYTWFRKIRLLYVLVAALLFIAYYPALSGLTVSRDYIDYVLRWFPTWDF